MLIPWTPPDSKIVEVGPALRPDVGIQFDPGSRPLDSIYRWGQPGRVQVDIPVTLTGRDRDLLDARLNSVRVEANGRVWRPRWDWPNSIASRPNADWLEFAMSESDLSPFRGQTATVHADVAVTTYELRDTLTLREGDDWRPVPAVGFLRVKNEGFVILISRRTALSTPGSKLIYRAEIPGAGPVRTQSTGIFPPDRFELHLFPVVTYSAVLETRGRQISPGAPIEVTVQVLQPISLVKRTLTIPNIDLGSWTVR